MRGQGATIWDMLKDCVATLSEPFRASEIVGWFRRHHPEVNETSLRTHIQGATSNVSVASRGAFATRRPLLTRIDHGLYVRARDVPDIDLLDREPLRQGLEANSSPVAASHGVSQEPSPVSAVRPDLLLVTCVKTKQPMPAAAQDLYRSPLFDRQRAYAQRTGAPWFILSAEHGLVAPDEWLAPYERYLADTPTAYREAWGRWVVARLSLLAGPLQEKIVEVHASEEYVAAIRAHLLDSGSTLVEPLRGLSQGRRLAWYDQQLSQARQGGQPEDAAVDIVERYVAWLSDHNAAIPPSSADIQSLNGPGLYSWWIDDEGAAELSAGLGEPLQRGLIYAGLAGATRWPSGETSGNTLAARIGRMHLGGNRELSTLRRTLSAILAAARDGSPMQESVLTDWMNQHLTVVARLVDDPDTLGRLETDVLARLDPPLNLRNVPPSPVRDRLRQLRSRAAQDVPSGSLSIADAEKLFSRAMKDVYERARKEANYTATYCLRMLADLGPLETARRLLHSPKPSEGFTALWERGRLDLTVENVVLQPQFADLFTEEDRDLARRRLATYGYEPR